MKKKIVSLFLALSLAFSLSVPALAATPEEAQDDAELLYNLGLFLGSSTNPDGTPKAVMVSALTGAGLDLLRSAIGEFAGRWREENPNEPRPLEDWEIDEDDPRIALQGTTHDWYA